MSGDSTSSGGIGGLPLGGQVVAYGAGIDPTRPDEFAERGGLGRGFDGIMSRLVAQVPEIQEDVLSTVADRHGVDTVGLPGQRPSKYKRRAS